MPEALPGRREERTSKSVPDQEGAECGSSSEEPALADGVQVRRRARLVYLVTPAFRSEVCEALKKRIAGMDAAAGALGAAGEQRTADPAIAERRSTAIRARDDAAARLAQIQGLADGSEVAEGFVEIVSVVRTGDSASRLQDAQIVISDGQIVEIRNP